MERAIFPEEQDSLASKEEALRSVEGRDETQHVGGTLEMVSAEIMMKISAEVLYIAALESVEKEEENFVEPVEEILAVENV